MSRMHRPINPGGGRPNGMPKGTTCKKLPCPRCGELSGQLSTHLEACDGGDA